jgi:hypothetical protein
MITDAKCCKLVRLRECTPPLASLDRFAGREPQIFTFDRIFWDTSTTQVGSEDASSELCDESKRTMAFGGWICDDSRNRGMTGANL